MADMRKKGIALPDHKNGCCVNRSTKSFACFSGTKNELLLINTHAVLI